MKLYQTTNQISLYDPCLLNFISLCVQRFFSLLLDHSTLITQSISKGFVSFIVQFSRYWRYIDLTPCNFIIISHFLLFVKPFSWYFLPPDLFIGQLIHNTTFFNDCQGVFSNFEPFRELLHIHQKPAYFFVHSVKQTCKSKKRTAHCAVLWRRRPDLNRWSRCCRPMPYHLAMSPDI